MGGALLVGQRDSDLVEPDGVEDAESVRHLDKVARVVEVEEGLSESRSLWQRFELEEEMRHGEEDRP